MIRSIIVILAAPTLMFSQNKQAGINVSAHYMATKGLSIQTPASGTSSNVFQLYASPAFEVVMNFPLIKSIYLEAGYRFKQHYLTFRENDLGGNDEVEVTHSIPIKISSVLSRKHDKSFKRLSITVSGGILADIMQQSIGKPLVVGSTFTVVDQTGAFSITNSFNPNDVNQVKTSVSLDAQIRASFRLFHSFDISLGYGFTQGTKVIGKGNYLILSPSGTFAGSMKSRGSYRYLILGLRLHKR